MKSDLEIMTGIDEARIKIGDVVTVGIPADQWEKVVNEQIIGMMMATGHTDSSFICTNQLRWIFRYSNPGPGEVDTGTKVLQQAWQGSNGAIKWEDVPVEIENE